jgi:hypothetical protein
LRGCFLWFGERGWWGEFRFCCREAEVLEKAEILVGNVDITVGGGSARTMIRKKKITDRARKASAIRDGESFESDTEGVGKECGS